MWDDACFACGRWGHYARDCPDRDVTAPGPWPPPPPKYVRPGPDVPRADAHAWADKIREAMGWSTQPAEQRRTESQQQTAARQAAESRQERDADSDPGSGPAEHAGRAA